MKTHQSANRDDNYDAEVDASVAILNSMANKKREIDDEAAKITDKLVAGTLTQKDAPSILDEAMKIVSGEAANYDNAQEAERKRRDELWRQSRQLDLAINQHANGMYVVYRDAGYRQFARNGATYVKKAGALLSLIDQVIALNAELNRERNALGKFAVDEAPVIQFPPGTREDDRSGELQVWREAVAYMVNSAQRLLTTKQTV